VIDDCGNLLLRPLIFYFIEFCKPINVFKKKTINCEFLQTIKEELFYT